MKAQINWDSIKNNAIFFVNDSSYGDPYIQPNNLGGWEDGLFISRDGLTLYCYYLPFDVFSLLDDFKLNPICFNSQPYFRHPTVEVDTTTNPWGCPNYFQGDIIIATKENSSDDFSAWRASNLRKTISNEGAPQGIPKNIDSLDLFVFTQNRNDTEDLDIVLIKNTPNNPEASFKQSIISSSFQEDNPHIERLNDSTLILLFDRERYVYYTLSHDNGNTWETEVMITQVINDQSPYDVQPHLWNDGSSWWIYFCADGENGKRGIYKSKQMEKNDWNSWDEKKLVIEPKGINGDHGQIFGVGEPSLTTNGDISFVVIYGNNSFEDTTNVFDSDPWFLPKKSNIVKVKDKIQLNKKTLEIYPNPASEMLIINTQNNSETHLEILNNQGNIIQRLTIHQSTQLDIKHLPDGIYYLQSKTNAINSIKFIKTSNNN